MAQQTFNNGETAADVRAKINANAADAEDRFSNLTQTVNAPTADSFWIWNPSLGGSGQLEFISLGAGVSFVGTAPNRTLVAGIPPLIFEINDESTALKAAIQQVTFRAPRAGVITKVRMSMTTPSINGIVTVDVNKNSSSILSTKLTTNVGQKTSKTATTESVITNGTVADDDEITIDVDAAGTGAKGVKVYIYLT